MGGLAMKKNYRGFGYIFRPRYSDKKTGERKVSEIWWVSYQKGGKQIRESAHTANESEAWRFLKDRDGKVHEQSTDRPRNRAHYAG
jgi:hypothetical protein